MIFSTISHGGLKFVFLSLSRVKYVQYIIDLSFGFVTPYPSLMLSPTATTSILSLIKILFIIATALFIDFCTTFWLRKVIKKRTNFQFDS